MIERETRDEHFKGDFGAHVSEFGAIEVESHGALGTVLGAFQPNKRRLRIDKASNKPRRGNAINPQMFARRPGASTIIVAITKTNFMARWMGLFGGEAC